MVSRSDYPRKWSRRSFLRSSLALGASLALPAWVGGTANLRASQSTLRLGVIPLNRADGVFDVAGHRYGLFAKHGVNVDYVELNTGALVLEALLAGDVDAAILSPGGALAAVSRGSGLKIIGSHAPGMPYLLYANQSVKSLRDLTSKRIGISQPGSLAHLLVVALLELEEDGGDLQWVNVGNDAQRFQALLDGEVDVTVTHMQYEPVLAHHPDIRVLANFAAHLPDYIRFAVVTRDDVIAERPSELQALALGLAEGIRYSFANADETIDLMAEYTRSTPEEVEWIFSWFFENEVLQPNFYLSPEAIRFMQELNVSTGQQDRVLPLEQVATWEFQEAVVRVLGRYPGYPG